MEIGKITLKESLKDFYDLYEDSYIHANEDGLIKLLIKHLQKDKLLQLKKKKKK